MDYGMEELLDEAITNRLTRIKDGTEHEEEVFNETVKLINLKIDSDRAMSENMKNLETLRIEREYREREHQRNLESDRIEQENREKELAAKKRDNLVHWIIDAGSLILSGVFVWAGFKFEETGSFTSKTFSEARKSIRWTGRR